MVGGLSRVSKSRRSVLVLVADPSGRVFLSSVLERHRVTLATTADEAAALLRREQYSLVIVTNLGLPPWLALDAIETKRDYPVLFLTGYVDPVIESICRAKEIPWLRFPDEISSLPGELRVALEDTIARWSAPSPPKPSTRRSGYDVLIMLKVFHSSSAAERLRAARAFVERIPAATEVLIVGASRDAADDLARRVTAARGATFGLHRASLTQLAVRLAAAEMARLDVPIAGPVERAFVEALTKVSPAVLVTVAAGDEATLEALRSLGAREEPSDADAHHDTGDLARARDFLFAAKVPPPLA